MEWDKLLTTKKLTEDPESLFYEREKTSEIPINKFEEDYVKIISSAAFRRLQDKTQVFPLDKSDFVRTRLTHSIEVSTVARQLGIMVISKLKSTSQKRTREHASRFSISDSALELIPSVLQCSGLVHDLGNPPFGHFGEKIIGTWFKENLGKQYKKTDLSLEQMLGGHDDCRVKDLQNFEGNAQALRILLKAKTNSEINLTSAVIGTLVKYPNNSCSFDPDSQDVKRRKFGYFVAEKDAFDEISENIGTRKKDESGNYVITRHPLAYLLEAADDIAYATADLEDAYKKGLFTIEEFLGYFKKTYDEDKADQYQQPDHYTDALCKDLEQRMKLIENKTSPEEKMRAFREWLASVRKWLMNAVAFSFTKNIEEICDGTYTKNLFAKSNHSITINALKDAMRKFAFNSESILKLELSAQTILNFLLNKFVEAAIYYDQDGEGQEKGFAQANEKYMTILPENLKNDYNNSKKPNDESYNLYLRLLMVTDYISGMTDTFARTLYRELSGIE